MNYSTEGQSDKIYAEDQPERSYVEDEPERERIFRRRILNIFQLKLLVMRYRFLTDPDADIQIFV